jgi:hypothetical protein
LIYDNGKDLATLQAGVWRIFQPLLPIMKLVIRLVFSLGLLLVCGQLYAQSQLRLRIAYNNTSAKYEVYANPTFTNARFTWGPSQITVVVPKEVADAPITARSVTGGVWLDQSNIFAPAAALDSDFHGFISQGAQTNLTANQELLLFDFSLPKFLAGVRLFDPAKDPNSAAPGMRGGDFKSYVSDGVGDAVLVIDTKAISSSTTSATSTTGTSTTGTSTTGTSTTGISSTTTTQPTLVLGVEEQQPTVQVLAYPNPSVTGTVQLQLKGFRPQEMLQVQWTSGTGQLLRQLEETAGRLNGQLLPIPANSGAFLLLTVFRLDGSWRDTQKVWVRE